MTDEPGAGGLADPPSGNGDDPGVDEALEEALDLGEKGDWDGMAQRLRDELEDHPDDAYILCWLGVAERELGMDGIAYERFHRALAQQPEDPRLLATAGGALAEFDDPEAESALRTAAMLGPDVLEARLMYGAYLSREGMTDDALRELDAALDIDPGDPTVLIERGVALAIAGRFEDARAAWARSVEQEEGDGWGLVLLGLVDVEMDDLEAAAASLEEGARLRPEDPEAQLLAALVLGVAGWDDRSLEMIERARYVAQGEDLNRVEEAESRLEEGPDEAREFLTASLAPSAFRERLMARP